jgi:riboflavin kinase/FMN adenylyltransferase
MKPLFVTIGVFDGVHRGHQALMRKTVQWAKKTGALPMALTFQDHPAHVCEGGPRVPFLLPREETFHLLREYGIREVRALRFTKAFSRKSPVDFVNWLGLLGELKGIVVGDDFRFGRGASGNVAILKAIGKSRGFKVLAVKSVRAKGVEVSSSRIRALLAQGRVEDANQLLGRPYPIQGLVVHGRHVGHKIGFPTANLNRIEQFLPRDGVYACAVKLGNRPYHAAMNLGKRPTFKDDDHHRAAEVHILNFHGKLYGKKMKVYLLKYLRAEKKFSSPAALVRQIQKDVQRTLGFRLPILKGG